MIVRLALLEIATAVLSDTSRLTALVIAKRLLSGQIHDKTMDLLADHVTRNLIAFCQGYRAQATASIWLGQLSDITWILTECMC